MQPTSNDSPEALRVLYIASEAEPLVKVGGLGDVAGSLPQTLMSLTPEQLGGRALDVRMVIPYHKAVREKLNDPQPAFFFTLSRQDSSIPVQTYFSHINSVPVSLISGSPISPEGPVYSSQAYMDCEKYIFFSVSALQLVKQINWRPDIIQANDWHTAISTHALKIYRQSDPFFSKTRSVLSIHNLPYMGADCEAALNYYHIPSYAGKNLPEWARRVPLPLGISAADHIIAVSPTYSQEIMTPEFGCGLDEYLKRRAGSISGILNGLNGDWDSATDNALPAKFTLNNIDARAINKRSLLNTFRMKMDLDIPLLIMITRMDYQKGVDLAIDALRQIPDLPWQAIILGTGDPILENACRNLESDFQDRVRSAIRYDAQLARCMYGGADMLLMPSRYEPCGLSQMIAMHYGCIPVARATGGLKDTIHDDPEPTNSNGFLFKNATGLELAATLRRAIDTYHKKEIWKTIQKRGMEQDFSWKKSAMEYAHIYFDLSNRQV